MVDNIINLVEEYTDKFKHVNELLSSENLIDQDTIDYINNLNMKTLMLLLDSRVDISRSVLEPLYAEIKHYNTIVLGKQVKKGLKFFPIATLNKWEKGQILEAATITKNVPQDTQEQRDKERTFLGFILRGKNKEQLEPPQQDTTNEKLPIMKTKETKLEKTEDSLNEESLNKKIQEAIKPILEFRKRLNEDPELCKSDPSKWIKSKNVESAWEPTLDLNSEMFKKYYINEASTYEKFVKQLNTELKKIGIKPIGPQDALLSLAENLTTELFKAAIDNGAMIYRGLYFDLSRAQGPSSSLEHLNNFISDLINGYIDKTEGRHHKSSYSFDPAVAASFIEQECDGYHDLGILMKVKPPKEFFSLNQNPIETTLYYQEIQLPKGVLTKESLLELKIIVKLGAGLLEYRKTYPTEGDLFKQSIEDFVELARKTISLDKEIDNYSSKLIQKFNDIVLKPLDKANEDYKDEMVRLLKFADPKEREELNIAEWVSNFKKEDIYKFPYPHNSSLAEKLNISIYPEIIRLSQMFGFISIALQGEEKERFDKYAIDIIDSYAVRVAKRMEEYDNLLQQAASLKELLKINNEYSKKGNNDLLEELDKLIKDTKDKYVEHIKVFFNEYVANK
jgi:hypothetical protein